MNNTILEILLWDNCKNHCKFCHAKNSPGKFSCLTNNEKKEAIISANNYIQQLTTGGPYDVLLCGGELFDSPFDSDTEVAWWILARTLVDMVKTGHINSLLLNTNLIYDIKVLLVPFLSLFKENGIIDKVQLTTSFDLIGRFKTCDDKNLMINNVSALRQLFPKMRLVANMILTPQLCTLILDGNIDVFNVESRLGIPINFIPYISLTKEDAPDKKLVLDTLLYLDGFKPEFLKIYVQQFKNERPRNLVKFKNGSLHNMTAKCNLCGHSVNFSRYSKSGTCFICDLFEFYKQLGREDE